MKVLIVGPLPAQADLIRRGCAGSGARIRFADPRRNQPGLPDADVTVLWVRFLGHRWSDALKRRLGRGRVVLHTGGLKGLVDRINQLAA